MSQGSKPEEKRLRAGNVTKEDVGGLMDDKRKRDQVAKRKAAKPDKAKVKRKAALMDGE